MAEVGVAGTVDGLDKGAKKHLRDRAAAGQFSYPAARGSWWHSRGSIPLAPKGNGEVNQSQGRLASQSI